MEEIRYSPLVAELLRRMTGKSAEGVAWSATALTAELLRIRIALAEGKSTKQDEAYVLLAISKAATLLQKNELKLLLGRIYAQIGEPGLSAAYLKEVSACPKELHITADAKSELARIEE